MTSWEILRGGPPTAEEAAAIAAALAAALAVVLAPEPAPAPVGRWRWSGRTWQQPASDWRDPGGPTHPSVP